MDPVTLGIAALIGAAVGAAASKNRSSDSDDSDDSDSRDTLTCSCGRQKSYARGGYYVCTHCQMGGDDDYIP